jgi:hypothetical protein
VNPSNFFAELKRRNVTDFKGDKHYTRRNKGRGILPKIFRTADAHGRSTAPANASEQKGLMIARSGPSHRLLRAKKRSRVSVAFSLPFFSASRVLCGASRLNSWVLP